MAIKLDDNGVIQFDETTGLSLQISGYASLEQDARSECRCVQNTYFADATYGRNPLVWNLSQRVADRIADINRIVNKYISPQSIEVDSSGNYIVTT
jgi:hypothetical protein